MPVYPPNKGPEIFSGKVLHTMEYSKLDKEASHGLLKGKKVAVIGYKKSAIDLAMECAEANSGLYILHSIWILNIKIKTKNIYYDIVVKISLLIVLGLMHMILQ